MQIQSALFPGHNKIPLLFITGWHQSYPRQKRWGLGLSVGYGYSFNKFSPYIGIGINYNLINW